jgi:hypothetical protein
MVKLDAAQNRALAVLVAALFLLVLSLVVGVHTAPPARQKSVTAKQQARPRPEAKPSAPPASTFPDKSRQVLPQHRFVALYGSPGAPRLGVLGEQPVEAAIQRAKDIAALYDPYSDEPVYPTLEIITTIASASATPNGDYSNEVSLDTLWPWITAAKEAGVYIVLDLQPGRADFLSQAKLYEPLLKEPHVGLALDPEWRLKPDQVHLKQIGSVDVAEVNSVGGWLADLTAQNNLPQKMLLLHQFRLSMITNRQQLDTSRKELAYVIQMDGNGAQSTKLDTWRTIQQEAPSGVYFGWKNFYDEDHPILGPDATMLLQPKPWYISYQ